MVTPEILGREASFFYAPQMYMKSRKISTSHSEAFQPSGGGGGNMPLCQIGLR